MAKRCHSFCHAQALLGWLFWLYRFTIGAEYENIIKAVNRSGNIAAYLLKVISPYAHYAEALETIRFIFSALSVLALNGFNAPWLPSKCLFSVSSRIAAYQRKPYRPRLQVDDCVQSGSF